MIRIRLPAAKPRAKFAYSEEGGTITLTPIVVQERRPASVRFEKAGRYTVAVSDQPISEAAIKEALAEFP